MLLEQRQYATQIGNDEIRFVRQSDVSRKRLDTFDTIAESIRASGFVSDNNRAARLHSVNLAGAVLACEQA